MDETVAPITLDEIKTAVKERHTAAAVELKLARTKRDEMNAKIKLLAAEEAESARILRTFEGRKTQAK